MSAAPVYDVVVHLRTLKLIETYKTKDLRPVDAAAQTAAFLASDQFDAMAACLASEAARHLDQLGLGRIGEGEGGGGAPPRKVVSAYVATDAVGVRAALAQRLQEKLAALLVGTHLAGLPVEVDYLRPDLPPAHFVVWTYPLDKLTDANWRELAGTTAEWLFLTQGRRMLMVRGLTGGELGAPSSFAMSAAIYGDVREALLLQGSFSEPTKAKQPKGSAVPPNACRWRTHIYFNSSRL
jgi:hypothetical protein